VEVTVKANVKAGASETAKRPSPSQKVEVDAEVTTEAKRTRCLGRKNTGFQREQAFYLFPFFLI